MAGEQLLNRSGRWRRTLLSMLLFFLAISNHRPILLNAAEAATAVEPAGFTRPSTFPLGAFPLCEPSAAVRAPWDDNVVLVGDDEIDDSLFAMTERDGALVDSRRIPLPRGARIDNIEALASYGERLFIVGSHSRNRQCQQRLDRYRILIARWDAQAKQLAYVRMIDSGHTWKVAVSSESQCLHSLFTQPTPPLAESVCRAIVKAERAAVSGTLPCLTFNIEGAVAVRGATKSDPPRLWIGLRSPLAEGSAVLLRLAPGLDTVRFDGVALLDLENEGVREMTLEKNAIMGIAGPTRRGPGVFRIWRVGLAGLEPGRRIMPELQLPVLPDASEGLVFSGDGVIALVDGNRAGKKNAVTCGDPGRQARVKLP